MVIDRTASESDRSERENLGAYKGKQLALIKLRGQQPSQNMFSWLHVGLSFLAEEGFVMDMLTFSQARVSGATKICFNDRATYLLRGTECYR